MLMCNRIYLLSLVALLTIGGCSSDGDERRQEYLDADYYTRLELPPDLTSPEDSKQLVSPLPSAEALAQFERDSAEVGKVDTGMVPVVVGIKVEGARIQSNDGVFWLEVDENADKLWPQLISFWSHEGIEILRSEPMLGFMETHWSSQLQSDEDTGFFKNMLNKLESLETDKFRMRVEPQGASQTRIFISHTGREMIVEGEDSNWHSRFSEEGLEREMLTRLSLYVGMDKQQATEALASYRPYSSRVRLSPDDVNTLYITGTMDVAWERSLRAFARMSVTILDKDKSQNQMKVAIGEITDEQLGIEKDELSESSWLMQWLKSAPDEAAESYSGSQFVIRLMRNDGSVRLEILDTKNEPAETVLAEQFRKTLAQELR